MNDINLRMEKLALLIGTMIGQLSQVLNDIAVSDNCSNDKVYKELRDIHNAAALQIHELYYKYNSENNKNG